MRYYPVNLDVRNRRCLVVGGGSVGARKAKTLLECGALVTLVSPVFTENLLKLADNGSLVLRPRSYQEADLNGMFLVIGATDDEDLNRRISRDAHQRNMLCNIADRPEACNFILPSIVNRGDLVIAISTSGKSPALAKKLRRRLEREFGQEYADFLRLMGAIRKKLLSEAHEPEAHKHLFEDLIHRGLIDMVRDRRKEDINALLREILGEGYEMETLIQGEEGQS